MFMHISHDHSFLNLRRRCTILWSWYFVRLNKSMMIFVKWMLWISPSGWPPRISVPPWSFETCSSSGCTKAGELTFLWWGMRSVSCSNSCYSMFASNCWSACSISWAKSHSSDGSPCLPSASYSDESTTCTGAVQSVCTCCAPCCICDCYASISCLHSSCCFRSFSLNSCNSFSASSILLLTLCLRTIRLSCSCLFSSTTIAPCSATGYAQNLQLFASSMQLKIFLFPFLHTGMLGYTTSAASAGALRDATSCCFANNHSKANLFIRSRGTVEIRPWVLLGPMKFPMDPIESNSHAVILHNAMWVIWIIASEVKLVLLHLFCFHIYLLDTLNLI